MKRIWHVVLNSDGMVLAVYGAALLAMAQEQAARIEHQTGLPVWVRQTGGAPHVGDTLTFNR